jgi:secreted Zn-dependent insulinase-like peptidase
MVQSASDKRVFHRSVLENGVDLLLVSLPGSGVGACAVDVNTGWW